MTSYVRVIRGIPSLSLCVPITYNINRFRERKKNIVFKREMESTLSVFVGVTVMDRRTENSDTELGYGFRISTGNTRHTTLQIY